MCVTIVQWVGIIRLWGCAVIDICFLHRLFRATISNPNGVVQVVNISMSEHSKGAMVSNTDQWGLWSNVV